MWCKKKKLEGKKWGEKSESIFFSYNFLEMSLDCEVIVSITLFHPTFTFELVKF